jgi:8-oxo-dGTP diphosphatase
MTAEPNAASVALIDRERVLLIQRARPPYGGHWTLPGGRCEPGENAEACAVREVREELGLTAWALRPVSRLILGQGAFHLQVFATEAFEGEIAPSGEVAAHRWVRPAQLHGLAVTPHLPQVLEAAFRLFDRR